MKYRMNLEYTVPVGDLGPYFDALWEGKALASECCECGRVAFPARAQCGGCSEGKIVWKELTGIAQVLFRTDSGPRSFALVKFDGADTLSTVALIGSDRNTSTGTLVAPVGDTPGLWLALDEESGGGKDDN